MVRLRSGWCESGGQEASELSTKYCGVRSSSGITAQRRRNVGARFDMVENIDCRRTQDAQIRALSKRSG
jgi:hypothetical protein